MLKPFFQGKLDTFCAIYAVLNALRLTHGIQTLKARDILNETLLSLAGKPGALRAVLEQDTDYMQLVDDMIQARQQRYPLLVESPLPKARPFRPTPCGKPAASGWHRARAAASCSAFCGI